MHAPQPSPQRRKSRRAPTTAGVGVVTPPHPSPGILVLAPPMRVLLMDPAARNLLVNLTCQENGNAPSEQAKGLLPRTLRQVCTPLFQHLRDQAWVKNRAVLEVQRRVDGRTYSVLIRGFGVLKPDGPEHARVVLRIEAIDRGKEETNSQKDTAG